MPVPQTGDELFVGRNEDGTVSEAFRRSPGGDVADITREVERVEVNNESFTVYGKRVHPAVEPWRVRCDRDAEATDTLLRGRVVAGLADWHAQCRERVAANMERYGLSPRERDVAWALFSDLTRSEIADSLGLATATVRNHLYETSERMGTSGTRVGIMLRLLDCEGLRDE